MYLITFIRKRCVVVLLKLTIFRYDYTQCERVNKLDEDNPAGHCQTISKATEAKRGKKEIV